MKQLNTCAACGETIQKRSSESWKQYSAKNYCSRQCASAIRFKKPITGVVLGTATANLISAMSGWHPGATKRHELRGAA